MKLPPDLWIVVQDFAWSNALGHTCQNLYHLVAHRFCSFKVQANLLPRVVSTLVRAPALQALSLRVTGGTVGLSGCERLARLRGAPIQRLNLRLPDSGIRDDGVMVLLPLLQNQSLTSLTLDFSENPIGRGGAALAAVSELSSLTDLHLHLRGHALGPEGFSALTQAFPSTLHHLTLGLECNVLGPSAADGIAGLARCTSLRSLRLELGYNDIFDAALTAFRSLGCLTSLRIIHLGLQSNCVGDSFLSHLVPNVPLQSLSLDLWGNDMTSHGLRDLGNRIAALPTLTALDLQLGHNRLEARAALALRCLLRAPTLQRLTINLEDNGVRANGAAAFISLAAQPSLTHLTLQLAHNFIADDGAKLLARMGNRHPPYLRLDLSENFLTDEGAQALTRLIHSDGSDVRIRLDDYAISPEVCLALAPILETDPAPRPSTAN